MDSHVRHVLAASLGPRLVQLSLILLLFVATLAIGRPFILATVHSCTVLDSTVSDWCLTWWTVMWDMSLLLLWGHVWCGHLVLSTAGFHFSITKPFLNLVISSFVVYDNWNSMLCMSWSFLFTNTLSYNPCYWIRLALSIPRWNHVFDSKFMNMVLL